MREQALERARADVPAALAALDALMRSRAHGPALIAAAWRGWLTDAEHFTRVMNAFPAEEQNATLSVRPYTPDPAYLARVLVEHGGERSAPLLAEILWKTGRGW